MPFLERACRQIHYTESLNSSMTAYLSDAVQVWEILFLAL